MNKEQAKQQLRDFLDGKIITFVVEEDDDGKWYAKCNEIPGIITGGKNNTQEEKESLIKDATLTAAGIPEEFCDESLLRDASLLSSNIEPRNGSDQEETKSKVAAYGV